MYRRKWYPESFIFLQGGRLPQQVNVVTLFAVSMDDLRRCKLSERRYICRVYLFKLLDMKVDSVKERVKMESIPEFMRYNIVECDIRNVV